MGLEILQNFHEIFKYFKVKYFIVHPYYSYVYHLRNRSPANLLRTQLINFSMRPEHVCMTRDPTVV